MIQLGLMGRDVVTSFEGIIMAHARYLTGCSQVLLAPTSLDKDGKRREAEWFDEQRVLTQAGEPMRLENHATPGADEPQAPTR
jgi:hypothetical protein